MDVYCYKGTLAWRHEISIRQRNGLTVAKNYKVKKSLIFAEVSESKPVGEVITAVDTACPYYFRLVFYRCLTKPYILLDDKNNLQFSQYKVDSSMVKINQFGEVTLEESLDFEVKRQHMMKVDLQCGPFKSSTTLLIQVLDVNDESPVFDQPSGTKFIVAENFKGAFGYVRATDPDSSFIYTVADNPYFAVNPYTGLLSTRQKLNYELDRFYGLQEMFVNQSLFKLCTSYTV